MTPELNYLILTATFTALIWIPYVLDALNRNKLADAMGYPSSALQRSA